MGNTAISHLSHTIQTQKKYHYYYFLQTSQRPCSANSEMASILLEMQAVSDYISRLQTFHLFTFKRMRKNRQNYQPPKSHQAVPRNQHYIFAFNFKFHSHFTLLGHLLNYTFISCRETPATYDHMEMPTVG